jgi:tetratricopeptide (TPR) repeat protein
VIRRRQGEYARAKKALTDAVEVNEKIGNQLWLATALLELGRLLKETGDHAGAREVLTRALEICRRHGIHRDEARALEELRSLGPLDETSAEG